MVYKAVHHGKQRSEALKVLFGKTAQRTAYFENEVRLVAGLRHPNIATLYEASLRTAPLFYTMEFVEGEQLDAYLRSHEVSLEERIELIKTVATAIGYAHSQGVVHRDLKPQNILIDAHGQPRIVDFGIAKRLGLDPSGGDASGAAGEGPLGTYGYIAPEQLAGERVDARADIYALGALLFHVVTGQPARFAPDPARLLEVLSERKVSRAADLAAIIGCCVNPVRENRYPTCAAFVADLDRYLAGRPISVLANAPPGYRLSRVAALVFRYHPWTVQWVAALCVMSVLIGAFWTAAAHWRQLGDPGQQVVLVTVTPQTLAAMRRGEIGADLPGFDPDDRRSYRLLYGQTIDRLAAAGPSVIVWDYYFPECRPEYDEAFVTAIRAAGVPVVIGDLNPDVNAQPRTCPEILAAVHAWGTLVGTRPGSTRGAVFLPLAIQRGLNDPIPALCLAAYAAARHPDCVLDTRIEGERLRLYYRKRQPAENEYAWLAQHDELPVFDPQHAPAPAGYLSAGDRAYFGRFDMRELPQWLTEAVPLERVLTGSSDDLRKIVGGRAVLIGQTVPPADVYEYRPGQQVFGCQIHALALNDLLAGAQSHRFSRFDLSLRVGVWCVVAVLVVNLLPVQASWSAQRAIVVALGSLILAVLGASWASDRLAGRWLGEVAVAACALVGGGAVALAIRLVHQRQLRLAPAEIWPASATTASTTLVAPGSPRESSEHRRSSDSEAQAKVAGIPPLAVRPESPSSDEPG